MKKKAPKLALLRETLQLVRAGDGEQGDSNVCRTFSCPVPTCALTNCHSCPL
jgi:hypothetical protein